MKNRFFHCNSDFPYIEKWLISIVVFLITSAPSLAQDHIKTEAHNPPHQNTQIHQKLLSLAENGDRDAQFNLGRIYLQGKGIRQDYQTARRWFMRAAEKEDAGAQYNLGNIYENGLGIQPDCKQALYWYKKAAAKSYAPAQYALGTLYSKGCGVAQNPYRATEWFLKAAENGIPEAQFQMGYRYSTGLGIQYNRDKAYEWLIKAAKQENKSAIHFLENKFNKPLLKTRALP